MSTPTNSIAAVPGIELTGKAMHVQVETERSLLALLLNPSVPSDVRASLELIEPEDFAQPSLRAVARIFRALEAEDPSTPPDLVVVGAMLEGNPEAMSHAELVALVAEHTTDVPDARTVAGRAEKLRRSRIQRNSSRIHRGVAEAKHRAALLEPLGMAGEAEAEAAGHLAELADLDELNRWPDPVHLPGGLATPEFPTSTLGPLCADFVDAVAQETGTPADIAALALLGVCSTLVAGAVQVSPSEGWREPVNLYMVSLLQPGEGKTPVLKKVAEPLEAIETERRDALIPIRVEAEQALRVMEMRLAEAEKRAVRAKDSSTRSEAEEEARNLAHEVANLKVPSDPRIYTRDATPEALVKLLGEQNGRLAVIRDEGSEFFEMASRYSSGGSANLGVYLEGFDGNRYVLDRSGRPSVVIERVTLTVSLMAQHILLEGLAKDRQMAGRGLFARFLWVRPGSIVGSRQTDRPVVSEQLRNDYCELMKDLAREAHAVSEPLALELEPEARSMFAAWKEQHEPRLRPEVGDLSSIVEWAGKIPGQVLRLAGNLHAIRTRSIRGTITPETMQGALILSEFFVAHALAVFGRMRADSTHADAEAVLRWISSRKPTAVTIRSVAQSKHWEPERVRESLDLLDRYGWVRKADYVPGRRGRPKESYFVNPQVLYS